MPSFRRLRLRRSLSGFDGRSWLISQLGYLNLSPRFLGLNRVLLRSVAIVPSYVEAECGDSHKPKKYGAHRAPLLWPECHRMLYGAAPTQTGGLNTELTGDSTGLVALAKENPGYGGTGADKLSSVEFAWFCRCLDARRDGEETTPTKPVLKARGQARMKLNHRGSSPPRDPHQPPAAVGTRP